MNDSNVVEPFTLDDNFDYDNVVLTPKYTTQEVVAFNNMLRVNVQQRQVCFDLWFELH